MQWLLSHHPTHLSDDKQREIYIELLRERHFATPDDIIRQSRLDKGMQSYYTSEILTLLNCEIRLDAGIRSQTWISYLFGNKRRNRSPLQHLLLMQFLGQTPETFFTHKVGAFLPFGHGPWPCLNCVADHYGELVVEQINVQTYHRHRAEPVGVFACGCGFVYARRGLDRTSDDRHRYDYVLTYGATWDEGLRTIWADDAKPMMVIAKTLGVGEQVVRYRARQLNLPLPRRSHTTYRIRAESTSRKSERRNWLDTRDACRCRWLEIIKANASPRRQDLREAEPVLYQWLIRNDRQWFEQHLPGKRSPGESRNDPASGRGPTPESRRTSG